MKNQPQNAAFRDNPENFHPCIWFGLKVSLKILHSGIILKTFTHAYGLDRALHANNLNLSAKKCWPMASFLFNLNSGIVLKTFTYVSALFTLGPERNLALCCLSK